MKILSLGSAEHFGSTIYRASIFVYDGKLVFMAKYFPKFYAPYRWCVTDMLIVRDGKLHRYYSDSFAAKAIEKLTRNSIKNCYVDKLDFCGLEVKVASGYKRISIGGQVYEYILSAKGDCVFELAGDNLPEIEED